MLEFLEPEAWLTARVATSISMYRASHYMGILCGGLFYAQVRCCCDEGALMWKASRGQAEHFRCLTRNYWLCWFGSVWFGYFMQSGTHEMNTTRRHYDIRNSHDYPCNQSACCYPLPIYYGSLFSQARGANWARALHLRRTKFREIAEYIDPPTETTLSPP